jgi:sugar lactone lactonase YvrE
MQKFVQRIAFFWGLLFWAGTVFSQPGTMTTVASGFDGPYAVTVDSAGNLYVADWRNFSIRKVSPGGAVSTVLAGLNYPEDVAVDAAGNLYIADSHDNEVLKVSSSGNVTVIAGKGPGFPGYNGEGSAASALLNNPAGVAVDSAGNIYIADQSNHRIRKVTPDGIISTIAGTGIAGFSGDGGPAVSAQINNPVHLALDAAGNLYIADYYNNRIRKVDTAGTMTTIAGSSTSPAGGFSGDGGPAIQAQLTTPAGVAVDSAGNIYIADAGNQRIREINRSGIIQTIAGGGTNGDGCLATTSSLNFPLGVAVNASATTLYIADFGANVIRAVQLGGTLTQPTLTLLSPDSGVIGTTNSVTISGSGFSVGGGAGCGSGPTTISVSGTGVTATDVAVISGSSVTVTLTIAAGTPAGTHDVTLTNANGTSNALTFSVVPQTPAPTITGISPSSGVRGTAPTVTLTGTNFLTKNGGTQVSVSGSGITVSNINVTSATSLTATFTIDATAATVKYNVTSSTSQGSSNAVAFTVNATPTITSITPPTGVRGSAVAVTISGSNFVTTAGGTQVSAGAGISVSKVNVTSATSLTATLTIDPAASLGNSNVSVSTAIGSSNTMPFTVTPLGPTFTYGLPQSLDPTQQAPLQLNVTTPSADPITGQVTFAFVPNAATGTDDPNVMFVNPQTSTRTVNFTIPANSTTAQFDVSNAVLQVGTVAGTVQLTTGQVQVAGQNVTPTGAAFDVTVPRMPPTITNVQLINRSEKGFTVVVTGYSDSKDITQATFKFTAKNGQLSTVQLQPDVTSIFSSYYQSSSEPMAGGTFVYTQPFVAQQGNANIVASVTVTLTNSVGASQPKTAP